MHADYMLTRGGGRLNTRVCQDDGQALDTDVIFKTHFYVIRPSTVQTRMGVVAHATNVAVRSGVRWAI